MGFENFSPIADRQESEPEAESELVATIENESEAETEERFKQIEAELNAQEGQLKQEVSQKEYGLLTKKLRKLAFAGTIMLSAFAVGCGAMPEKQYGPENSANAERVDKQKQEKFDKDKTFLNGVFQRISGGGIAKSEDGNLIVHVGGGRYYELENSDLEKLMDISGRYRERVERAEKSKSMKAFVLKLKDASAMTVEANVIRLGKRVSAEQLPGDLKGFEDVRKQVVEEMEKGPEIGDKTLHSEKTTSPEAEDFLN